MSSIVKITSGFDKPLGRGTSRSPDSVLIRPFRKLFNEGSSVGRLVYILYQERDVFPSRLLASLVYSDQKRFIFFPGLIIRKFNWTTRIGKQNLIGHDIDHITLEPCMRKWHFTSTSSKKRSNYRTQEIEKDVYYWFGMSVGRKDFLEEAPEELIIEFKCPESDASRRFGEIFRSRDGSKFPLILMDKTRPDDCFIHFDIFVDMRSPRNRRPITKKQPPSSALTS